MINKFYVYLHRKQTTGVPFYVGKGCNNRATDTCKSGRNSYWLSVFNKHGLIVEIVADNLSEKEAFNLEKEYIFKLKHFEVPLTNLTDGGEGANNFEITDDYRLKMSESLMSNSRGYSRIKYKRPSAGGINNHFSDKNKYYFTRLKDGLVVLETRSDLVYKFCLARDQIKKLFYKNENKRRISANGWRLSNAKEVLEYERKQAES